VDPIRTVNAINKIKKALAPSPRNFAIFAVGINTDRKALQMKDLIWVDDDFSTVSLKMIDYCQINNWSCENGLVGISSGEIGTARGTRIRLSERPICRRL
jgi:hypothetical protein